MTKEASAPAPAPASVTEHKRHSRFADLTTSRLEISEGDWIEVRKELTIEEDERMSRLQKDPESSAADVLALLVVEWSLVDDDGKPVEVSRDSIAALRADDALEISAVYAKFMQAITQEKKARSTKGKGKRPLQS